ncbi:hypothetical protein [Rhizobium sp. BK538]|nr:hypothetical protein [Rhizobium sp. BK538]MBB4168919.1 hypothetical protein [Rhizobium sp. BK538]TCM75221.1 hypothetical protein EV291_115139 [Rhizobium sp. BK068]
METVEITNRSDFALWTNQRAQEIVTVEGAALAMAARDMNEEALAETAAALGKAISDASPIGVLRSSVFRAFPWAGRDDIVVRYWQPNADSPTGS